MRANSGSGAAILDRMTNTLCRRSALLLLLAGSLATAQAAKVEMVVGGTSFRKTVGERHWLEFQQKIDSGSRGEIKPKMLIHGELGSEEQIVSGLRRGRVQYANLSGLITSTLVPEAALLYAPYLFDSAAEADYVLDRYLSR